MSNINYPHAKKGKSKIVSVLFMIYTKVNLKLL